MLSWLGTNSYFNNEQIQMSNGELMNAAYGSPGSSGSRVRSKKF